MCWGFRQFHSSFDFLSFAENPWAHSHLFRWVVKWYSSWPIKGLTKSSDRWQGLGPHEFVIAVTEITFGPCSPSLEEKCGASLWKHRAGKILQKVNCGWRAGPELHSHMTDARSTADPGSGTDRLIPYSCKIWGGREAGKPSRLPGLIPLKIWARLQGQRLPVFCSMAPEASLTSPRGPIFEGQHHTYHICCWIFLCCIVGAVMKLFLAFISTVFTQSILRWMEWFVLMLVQPYMIDFFSDDRTLINNG